MRLLNSLSGEFFGSIRSMKPTADRVLIRADKPKDKTESGLLIVENWKTLPATGVVVALGPDAQMEYIDGENTLNWVRKGDRVMFERYGSVILEDDLRLCIGDHVLGVFI